MYYFNVYLWIDGGFIIHANHYNFSVIVTNFGPKLRCYGQQSTCYGFPIIAGPEPFSFKYCDHLDASLSVKIA